MENIILKYQIVSVDEDLIYTNKGIAYQKDMSKSVDYDSNYFDNYVNRSGTDIAKKLNDSRVEMSEAYCKCLVDVGIGSGEFIESSNIKVYGYDINPSGISWLKERNLFVDIYKNIPKEVEGFTLWDTLEHMPNPCEFLSILRKGQYLFISLPTFEKIDSSIKESKHYKPNEHYYYYSKSGLINFVNQCGYNHIETNMLETVAGRDGVTSFGFIKE